MNPESQAVPPSDRRSHVVGVGTFTATARAKELVMAVLDSNRISYGPMMQRFESDFAHLHGCRFGIMSNSGTGALQLALQALKEVHNWADGDEVIVPAVTFVATANIVLHCRMTPVLVDIEPKFYEIDPKLIEQAITPRTRAIIPVHLFGQPADMPVIVEIARRHRLKLIEDSAETMFASIDGKRVGSLGDIGCFSTYAAHLLVTGVGGMNTTNTPEYAIKMRSLLNHGRDSIYISIDDDKGKKTEELRTIVERRFRFVSIGHSFRATEMEAALGLAQLEEWEPMIEKRRRNAALLTQELKRFDNDLQTPEIRDGSEHSFMMYPLVLRHENKRRLVNFLEENGIETRDMLPLTNQPVYHHLLGWNEDDYPIAKWVNNNGFYIGCHQDLSDIDFDYVLDSFGRFFRGSAVNAFKGVALILLADELTSEKSVDRESLSTDLFIKTLVIDSGMPPAVRKDIEQKGFEVLDGSGTPELELIAKAAPAMGVESVVMFPLNGQWNAADIPRLALTLNRGYDLVIGSRFIVGGSRQNQQSNIRSVGNRFFNMLANLLFAGNLSDAFSSFRAIRLSKLTDSTYAGGIVGLFALSIEALKHRWRVQEIPTSEVTHSRQQVFHDAMSSAFPAFWIMVRQWSKPRDR